MTGTHGIGDRIDLGRMILLLAYRPDGPPDCRVDTGDEMLLRGGAAVAEEIQQRRREYEQAGRQTWTVEVACVGTVTRRLA